MRAKALGALQTMLATQGQTVEEDHRAFRTLSIGQEDRTANRVKVRPFAGLNLLKTAECLAVVARWIRMAPQSFAGRAQRKMEGGAAEIRNGEERQEQGQPEPNHPPDNFSRLARQKFHQERIHAINNLGRTHVGWVRPVLAEVLCSIRVPLARKLHYKCKKVAKSFS